MEGLPQGELEDLLAARSERDVPIRGCGPLPDDFLHLRTNGLEGDPHGSEDPSGHAVALAKQTEQDVLGADVVVVEHPRLFLGKDDDAPGTVGESLEHVRSVGPGSSGVEAARHWSDTL